MTRYTQPPKRLKSEQFMPHRTAFNVFYQTVREFFPLHWHEFYELCFVVHGRGVNLVNGRKIELERGSVFLLTPSDFHELFPVEGESMEMFNVIFSADMIGEELNDQLFASSDSGLEALRSADFERLHREFAFIQEEAREGGLGHTRLIRGALERILVLLLRQSTRAGAGSGSAFGQVNSEAVVGESRHYPAIRRALVYIHHHFRQELKLQEAAKQARLATNYFSECFRKTTGVTFQDYVNELRLRFAHDLLLASAVPITEVCFASGYNTLSHFERVYKRKYGVSPQGSRKR
ncbi:AraC family transcriptional regulator [Paenibacillus koleovorans]|uniref:AraC family transcriptional regulator n=1 Tax=Paenibacillus koleovorans TaxID=121608 RepID=UPI0013E2FD75|nr:AraC family transcriptional regulator [Paenibacillus koleovorans]